VSILENLRKDQGLLGWTRSVESPRGVFMAYSSTEHPLESLHKYNKTLNLEIYTNDKVNSLHEQV